jgi:hypothetical protein
VDADDGPGVVVCLSHQAAKHLGKRRQKARELTCASLDDLAGADAGLEVLAAGEVDLGRGR